MTEDWAIEAQKQKISEFDLDRLAIFTRRRLPKHPNAVDVLPDMEFSTFDAMHTMVEKPTDPEPKSRFDFADQKTKLQYRFAGQSLLLFYQGLSISYLRRRTPYTQKAASIFFKIWDEQGDWVASQLNPRWLISALQTFADHGRNAAEVRAGSIGFLYGSMIKVYETEIASTFKPASNDSPIPGPFLGPPVWGMYGFQPGDNALLNINAFVMSGILGAGPASLAALALMGRIKKSKAVFTRMDHLADNRRGFGVGFRSFNDE
ncbi:hypothetical protein [Paracoccus pacificus]|uniref:Uncharacterized protein n=1 Tax=Paracoccus pacificus TaxID=1463598 RepID=A0ABW4R822_9RHOB